MKFFVFAVGLAFLPNDQRERERERERGIGEEGKRGKSDWHQASEVEGRRRRAQDLRMAHEERERESRDEGRGWTMLTNER